MFIEVNRFGYKDDRVKISVAHIACAVPTVTAAGAGTLITLAVGPGKEITVREPYEVVSRFIATALAN
ncbi:hypothetical protein [Paracoccus haeundaensis]|uniref:Uncharacterized protein n=1 Tax=Paracoccus haeundaensis TaxID=225362 RepID=A0A5C4RBJ9_9RHOB|nr:hypothetical protein [Paracoccus haeundaensis]TNH41289.1 hypothetical protein FHD67_00815 [Paracoccus haeundaensis]